MTREVPLFEKQIDRCKSHFEENELLGFFSCQGELSEDISTKMINSKNESMQRFGRMRDRTLHHPDHEDIESAKNFAAEFLNHINSLKN